jgi:hypothetical protein
MFAAALASLTLGALPASAGNLRLRWNSCLGDGGVQNRAFACNTNSGAELLVASFVPTGDMHGVVALESRIDLRFASSAQPAWWQFRPPLGCRLAALGFRGFQPADASACTDWGENGAIGLVAALDPMPSLQVQTYLPVGSVDLLAGQEYFAFGLGVGHQKTVGASSCAGCTDPGCLTLQYMEIEDSSGAVTTLNVFSDDMDWLATWQGGIQIGGVLQCGLIGTPTRRTTWAAVKSLYH